MAPRLRLPRASRPAHHRRPPPQLHLHPTPATATIASTSSTPRTTVTAIAYTLTMSLVASVATILSLFALNPFAKLTDADFSDHKAAPWTAAGFLGSADCYSLPSSLTQARMRVHKNVKRFARNYATILILFFACALRHSFLSYVLFLKSGFLSSYDITCIFPKADPQTIFKRKRELMTQKFMIS